MIVFDQNQKIFNSTLINDHSFFSGFGTKYIGDGRKSETIIRFLNNNEIEHKKIITLDQIHSSNVEFIDDAGSNYINKIEDTDGVVTNLKQTVITVITADCSPIIYCDKKAGLIGISHNGWRGTIKRLGQKIIKTMIDYGSKPEDIKVAIGPTINQCCYDIPNDRYYEFLEEFDGFSEKIFKIKGGRYFLNLILLNYLLLVESQINPQHIDYFPFCTQCDKDRLFSFRRKDKDYGEMVSFIVCSK